MATTHVFIVGENTFKYHLNYLFAGTGAQDKVIDFNNKTTTNLYHTTENNLVGMIADAQRIRKGDFILFYLQQSGGRFGKFYGVFQAIENHSFLDNNTKGQYLFRLLGKSLTFRTLIAPYAVYSQGITEWAALDSIKNLNSPYEMIWSLIYRKLKGNRGNTMITLFESDKLIEMIRSKNSNKKITSKAFDFDFENEIIIKSSVNKNYSGRHKKIILLPRLRQKYISGLQFELHLQAYINEFIGLNINRSLDSTVLNGSKVQWLGNEVSCGVGMQSIDVLVYCNDKNGLFTVPIELKSVTVYPGIVKQVQRYVDWLNQYFSPLHPGLLIPTVITRKFLDKTDSCFLESIKAFNSFNHKNKLKIKLIEFSIVNNNLFFDEYIY